MYCDDEETGKKVVFNKEHMEGMYKTLAGLQFSSNTSFGN